MSKDRIFSVSVYNKEGKEIGSAVLPSSKRYLTVGKELDNDISISIPGIPDGHRFLENTRSKYALIIPPTLNGVIYRDPGKDSMDIKTLVKRSGSKNKKGSYVLPFSPARPFFLKAEDITFYFSYNKAPQRQKSERIERSLKKSLISKDDHSFLFLILILTAINFSAAGYLRTIEIKRMDHIEALQRMPERFAKLIFKPAAPKIEKKIAKSQTEEKKEEEKPQKEEPKKEAKKEKTDIAMAKPSPPKEISSSAESTVKSKGLLGVITAKEKPVFASRNLFDIDSAEVQQLPKFASVQDTRGSDASGTVKRLDNIEMDAGDRRSAPKTKDIGDILKEKKVASLGTDSGEQNKKTDVKGDRNESDVYRTVFSYSGGVKYLYNNALRKDPSLKGKVTVKLTISEEGKVTKVEIVSSTLNNPELEESIMKRIYKWQFSDAKGSGDYVITYTFDFSPTN